ncbi:MAG: hypothetical protein PWR10_1573 [Halanaerobiales bacterium]|nr:hypothetical protein [Halanaerobiales bacterium]
MACLAYNNTNQRKVGYKGIKFNGKIYRFKDYLLHHGETVEIISGNQSPFNSLKNNSLYATTIDGRIIGKLVRVI